VLALHCKADGDPRRAYLRATTVPAEQCPHIAEAHIVTPVEIARQALRRLTDLSLPPTPENYEAQYRAVAGLPPPEPIAPQPAPIPTPVPAPTLEAVRALLQGMASTNEGLQADLSQFSQESSSLLAELEQSTGPAAPGELFRAMVTSSTWLLGQVNSTQQELERTRQQLTQVHSELERVQSQAGTDVLTGLPNRRALDTALSRELARARRSSSTLCLALIDIDHFKRVNDQFGHVVGDQALTHLAQVFKPAIRETDVLARFGGEEFVLVLPDTPMVGAEFMLNRLLRAIERAPLQANGDRIELRFSAGLAQWQPEESAQALIERADRAMYEAKAAGRARVMVAELKETAGSSQQLSPSA